MLLVRQELTGSLKSISLMSIVDSMASMLLQLIVIFHGILSFEPRTDPLVTPNHTFTVWGFRA